MEPCKYGHFDCSATEGGPCSNELAAPRMARVAKAPSLDNATSWHHHRDGMGSVIGPRDADGFYPILVNGGLTYEQAVAAFGPEVLRCGPEPVTCDVDANSVRDLRAQA